MKNKSYKILKSILLFCALSNGSTVVSQQTTSYSRLNIKTPGVTDFIRYGNIQASYFTGNIDLNIPLVSAQNSNQSPINVGLIYNSAGFMPSKRSGLVGLNWALNVGGVISRQIKGVPDDYVGRPNEQSPSILGEFDKNGFIIGIRKNSVFATNDVFNFNPNSGFQHFSAQWMLGSGNANSYEGSPDIFEFNFNGISGKFSMGNDGKIKVVTNQSNNLIVDITGISQQNGTSCKPIPSEIKITDNEGNQYFFGGTLNNLEYTISLGDKYTRYMGIINQPIITSWFLRKIIYSNNSQIDFTYRTDTFEPDDMGDGPISNLTNNKSFLSLNQYIYEERTFSEKNTAFFGSNLKTYASSATSGVKTTYELQKKVILDKIEGDNFIINFKYGPQLYKFNRNLPAASTFEYEDIELDNINVTDKNFSIIKKIDFSYVYLGGTYNRMFLETMTESGKKPYKFEYNTVSNLPDPSSRGVDYWGFWNGLDSQKTLIPDINYTINGDFSYTSNTREPSFDKSKQGLLAKVIYPTGGYTKFEYEPHLYSQLLERPSSNNFLPTLTQKKGTAGGARVSRITDFDGISNTNIRDFKYVNNYSPTNPANIVSSGILLNWPRYAIHWDIYAGTPEHISDIRIKSNSINTSTLDTSIITYSEVVETTNGNGYTVNSFKDYSSTPDVDVNNNIRYNGSRIIGAESSITPIALYKNYIGVFFDDRSSERGKLISKKKYDNSNNLKNEELFTYNNSANRFDRYSISIHNTGVWSQSNRLYYYNDYLTQKTNIAYSDGNSITSIEKYNYGTGALYDNLVSQSITKSQTGALISNYYYPHDPLMAKEPFDAQLIAKNIIGEPLKTESFNDAIKLSEQKTIFTNDVTTSNLLLPKANYAAKFPNSLPSLSFGQLEKQVTYDQYDNKGNLLQYTPEGNISVCVIWGYNKTQAIAKIENTTYGNIPAALITAAQNASDSGTETTLLAALTNLRNAPALAGTMVTGYTYIPLVGISTITDSKGDMITYKYDSFGRLEFVRDAQGNLLSENQYHYKN